MNRVEALRSAIDAKAERHNALRASLAEYATRDAEPVNEERDTFAADLAEFDAIGPELEQLRSELAKLEAVLAAPEQAREAAAPTMFVRKADPLADEAVQYGPVDQVRGAARTAIEGLPVTEDHVRERLYRTLERADDASGRLARHMIAASRPSYRSAFAKLISGQTYALTPDEARSVEHVRAASLTDSAGGYAVPTVLDSTLLITGAQDGVLGNSIRQLANVVQTTADNYNVNSTAGITAAWAAEAAEASDNAPTIAQTTITPIRAQAFVPFSMEIQQDWMGMEAEMRRLLMFARDNLELTGFALGTGSNQPLGLVYDLYTNYSGQVVASATTDTFAKADLTNLVQKIAARYRANGSFIANEFTYDAVRNFTNTGGATIWTQLDAARPALIFGRPAYSNPAIDGVINATADNYVMVFGDIAAGYTIVDRIGMTVELVPHLFGSNRRPTGQRGLYAMWRTGARVVDSGALALLNVT